jgi:hypothetical protein
LILIFLVTATNLSAFHHQQNNFYCFQKKLKLLKTAWAKDFRRYRFFAAVFVKNKNGWKALPVSV